MIHRLLTRIDRAAGGLATDFLLYALSAAFALFTARTSILVPHRAWGSIACWAYLAAAVLAAVQLAGFRRAALPAYAGTRARAALAWLAWVGVCLLPLIVEAVQRVGGRTDRAQDEVLVVERMGQRLLDSGTPYVGRDAILALPPGQQLGAYSPYQPGMAIFGLPRAIFGVAWWTDARVWFAVVTAGALVAAVSILGRSGVRVRAIQIATVFPICALTLATGGDDLPVLALCLLALALAGRGQWGWAGVAVGAAAAAKLFAFPVVAVLIALAAVQARRTAGGTWADSESGRPGDRGRAEGPDDRRPTDGSGNGGPTDGSGDRGRPGGSADRGRAEGPGDRGRNHPAGDVRTADGDRGAGAFPDHAVGRRSLRLLAGALTLPILVLIPPALVNSGGFVENVLRFPLGHGVVPSPAQSPFPGYLIAQHLPAGRFIAAALLVAVAAAIGVRLLRNPPRTATASALVSGWGLLAAILLMPTTRFGYLLYPAAFLVWAAALRSRTAADHRPASLALYRE